MTPVSTTNLTDDTVKFEELNTIKAFNQIANRSELCEFLGVPQRIVTHILYHVGINNLYKSFEIPKKNGGTRKINAPKEELKQIQEKLLQRIMEHESNIRSQNNIKLNISHAFEKNKSFITNAKIHKNKRVVLNLDLKDFFNSFHFGRVRGYFEKNKNYLLPKEIATIIAQLTCYNKCLPQGAPTSPIITNLIFNIVDIRILKIAKKYKVDYTRYADDLTFSTNDNKFKEQYELFYKELEELINDYGFSINEKKTRLQFRDSRQEVTGLIVNKKINVSRQYYKNTRAMADSFYSTGKFTIGGESGTKNQLEGRLTFINQIDWFMNKLWKLKKDSHKLNTREKQYQKFLFYKYFFNNDMPIIVTEGKTDIIYLKASLRNLYQQYPNLVSKEKDGTFTYKISFLKRTKRLQYFFDFSMDGGDALTKLLRFLTEDNICRQYYKYFKTGNKKIPNHPLIFFYDNETKSEKPLKKLLTSKPNKSNKSFFQQALSSKHYFHYRENNFIMTNPLVGGKEECEIEDLFGMEVLSHKEGVRTFSRNDKYDKSKFYGKNDFSKYVLKNYANINFDNFKIILDNIETIIKSYSEKT